MHCLFKYLYCIINQQLTVVGAFVMLGQHVGMVSEDVLGHVITLHDRTEVVLVWFVGLAQRNVKTRQLFRQVGEE